MEIAQANEAVEMKDTTWSWFNVNNGDGLNWTQPYNVRSNGAGIWKVGEMGAAG